MLLYECLIIVAHLDVPIETGRTTGCNNRFAPTWRGKS